MKKIFVLLVSILLIIAQVTFTPHFRFFKLNYGLILSGVIVVACIYDFKTSIFNALISGVVLDTFASSHYGVYILLFSITVIITFFVSDYMYKGNIVTSSVLTLILTILSELVLYYIFGVFRGVAYHSYALTRIILPQALLNTFISVIVFGIYKSLYKKLKLDKQW